MGHDAKSRVGALGGQTLGGFNHTYAAEHAIKLVCDTLTVDL